VLAFLPYACWSYSNQMLQHGPSLRCRAGPLIRSSVSISFHQMPFHWLTRNLSKSSWESFLFILFAETWSYGHTQLKGAGNVVTQQVMFAPCPTPLSLPQPPPTPQSFAYHLYTDAACFTIDLFLETHTYGEGGGQSLLCGCALVAIHSTYSKQISASSFQGAVLCSPQRMTQIETRETIVNPPSTSYSCWGRWIILQSLTVPRIELFMHAADIGRHKPFQYRQSAFPLSFKFRLGQVTCFGQRHGVGKQRALTRQKGERPCVLQIFLLVSSDPPWEGRTQGPVVSSFWAQNKALRVGLSLPQPGAK
jgi:hypothetical protein